MKEFLDFLKTFFIALCKFLFLVLFKLYLIIPLSALLIILIASAAAGFNISDYSGYVIIILVLCLSLSVLLFLRGLLSHEYNADPKKEIRSSISKSKILTQQNTKAETAESDNAYESEERMKKKSRLFSADIKGRTFNAPQKENTEQVNEERVPDTYENSVDTEQLTMFEAPEKREQEEPVYPRYLRTRRDPNIILVEYSDRLEVYRKTINGMQYIETEYKPNSSSF